MPNGLLRLFDKVTSNLFVNLQILGNFNIEQNLNDTPSNMKIKAITNASFREEFEVNTIAYHEDTNTWWVIKSDESTYLHTGEYEHEISLVELLEFFSYKHLANCAFAPNTYTLDQMLKRVFRIGNIVGVNYTYPAFLDKDKIMPFMSFENFTVANAIKNISRSLNAIPKMSAIFSLVNGGSIAGFNLTFVNRLGIENTIVNILNDQFPVAYEKNTNSNDQFLTRSVSNITNAKSSNLVIAPLKGGLKIATPNSLTYNKDNAIVYLPSKIDKIEWIRLYPTIELVARGGVGPADVVLYTGFYTDKEEWANVIDGIRSTLITTYNLTNTEVNNAISNLPDPQAQAQFNYNDTINRTSYSLTSTFFNDKLTVKNKFDFDTTSTTDEKERTCHWTPNTNELVMSKTFRYGLNVFGFVNFYEANQYRLLVDASSSGSYDIYLKIKSRTSGFFADRVPVEEVLIQVGYYPISDIKVSIDNDNNAQDEKFFNQTGKVIDAVSTTQLITSHTNDSVEGTKIRNARYTNFSNLLPVGQLVRDSNQLYIISQRSIDGQVKDGNEYYNVLYTLSRNRIARSENIVADSSVISYKTPDDNLVFRNQLYKDYIELSLNNINQDTPYLSMDKALVFGNNLAGTNFDYTVLASNNYGTAPQIRYVKNPIVYDLHKSKLMNVNWQDNNVLGFRLDSTGNTFVQTPIVYTDNLGKATSFELLFLDTKNLTDAVAYYNSNVTTNPIIPFDDLTNVPNTFYTTSAINQNNVSIRINSNTRTDMSQYTKDPFEIPVFEYMLQANDDYSDKGNIVVGNDLFSTFTGNLIYRYVISNDKRITAENALALYGSVGAFGWVLTTDPFFYQTSEPNAPVYNWEAVIDPFYYQTADPTATTYKWEFVSEDYYYQANDPTAQVKEWNLFTAGTFYYQDATPSSPTNGDYWYVPDTGELYRRTSGSWLEVMTTWTQSSTAPSIGGSNELWVNTSDEKLYVSSVFTPTIVNGTLWYNTDTEELNERVGGSWVFVSSISGTSLPTPTSAGLYFVDLSEPVLYKSVIDTIPVINENSYWFNPTDGVLKRWLYSSADDIYFWQTIPSGDITTGTSLPSVSSGDKYFVNTSLQILYISVLEIGTGTTAINSYWYNPTDNTLKQYRSVIGTLQWVTVSATISATEPEATTSNQRWVKTSTQQLFISQFIPAADLDDNELNRVVILKDDNEYNLALFSDISGLGTPNTTPIKNIGFYAYDVTGTKVKFLFAINDYAKGGSNTDSNIYVYINNWKI